MIEQLESVAKGNISFSWSSRPLKSVGTMFWSIDYSVRVESLTIRFYLSSPNLWSRIIIVEKEMSVAMRRKARRACVVVFCI